MAEPAARLLRLRAFELLIFVVLALLAALCLTAAPVVLAAGAPPRAVAAAYAA